MSPKSIMVATPDQIEAFRSLAIAAGLDFYNRTGQLLNRAYKPMALMREAEKICRPRRFKARDYAGAALAIRQKYGVAP